MGDSMLQAALREFLTEAVLDRFRLSGLHIDGVEVTQAIQYRAASFHLTDPADRGPDNSVRLVADKPARVRVYVRNFPATISGVTGSVTVQKRRYGIWSDAGPLTQLTPASIGAEPYPDFADERRTLASSLNFLIPASVMRGHLRLKVKVVPPGGGAGDETTVDVDASLKQTLKLRGIPVRYDGPDAAGNRIQLPAPTLADFRTTAVTTLRMFPVSQTPDISLAGIFTWNSPLLGAIVNGNCPTSWNNILFWLGIARVIDGNKTDSIYYALLPNGIPTGGASGCGGGSAGVGAGSIGDGMAMAHEIGHVLGFPHAPCGLVTGDAGDPNYPAYEPYDTTMNRQASIGEYGLDVTAGVVYPPGSTADFMSYCGPSWISLFHTQALVLHPKFNPTWVSDGRESLPPYLEEQYHGPSVFDRPDPPPPWVGRQVHVLRDPDPVRLIVLTGVIENEQIEIRSLLRLETSPQSGGERIAGTVVELLDANLRVLQRAPLRRMATQASCCCGGCGGQGDEPPSGLVQALLPDIDGVQTVRIMREETEIWSRQATAQPPSVSAVVAETDAENLTVRWQTTASDAYPIERAVRWSADGGKRWQALAIRLEEDLAVVPLRAVTCGSVLVQVIVSDGFYGASSEPVAVDIPRRPPEVAILWPVQGALVRTDEPLRLWGTATACDGSVVPEEGLRWYLDGEPVGSGPEVWVPLREWEGEHKATLRAGDECGPRAEATVVFLTSCSGRRPYRSQQLP